MLKISSSNRVTPDMHGPPVKLRYIDGADLTEGGPEAEAHGAASNDVEGAVKHAACVPHRHQLGCAEDVWSYPAPGCTECVKQMYVACNTLHGVYLLPLCSASYAGIP